MQDRLKYRYVFTKDFGGKTGICYKMPIFDLDTIVFYKLSDFFQIFL